MDDRNLDIVLTKETLFDPGSEAAFNKELKATSVKVWMRPWARCCLTDMPTTTVPSSGSASQDAVNDFAPPTPLWVLLATRRTSFGLWLPM